MCFIFKLIYRQFDGGEKRIAIFVLVRGRPYRWRERCFPLTPQRPPPIYIYLLLLYFFQLPFRVSLATRRPARARPLSVRRAGKAIKIHNAGHTLAAMLKRLRGRVRDDHAEGCGGGDEEEGGGQGAQLQALSNEVTEFADSPSSGYTDIFSERGR